LEAHVTPSAAIALGFALIALGIPMILKWVPRAGFDWISIPGLSLSDDAWYESHRRSGWDFVMIGAGVIALSLWMRGGGEIPAGARDFLGVSIVLALVIAGVRSVIFTCRLGRERDTIL
jgi:hypothetical protein